MIRISVRVGDGGDAVGVTVQAESIGHALRIADSVFPGSALRVSFPLDPESFFVRDGSTAGLVETVLRDRQAG